MLFGTRNVVGAFVGRRQERAMQVEIAVGIARGRDRQITAPKVGRNWGVAPEFVPRSPPSRSMFSWSNSNMLRRLQSDPVCFMIIEPVCFKIIEVYVGEIVRKRRQRV